MILTIIIAWILTWFNLDDLIITGINEVLNTDYTVAVYWLVVFIIAVVAHISENAKD